MRNKKRISRIMRFFRKNHIAFAQFIGIEVEDTMFLTYRNNFESRYEELFEIFLDNPDLRFGQLLINEGVIPDGQHRFTEETTWLVENKWMKPETIMIWGSLSLTYNSQMSEWESQKPKFNEKMKLWEMYSYKGLRPIDVYALKYNQWIDERPAYTYNFIEDLQKDHIENILKNCKVSDSYKEAFKRVLEK